MSKMIQIRNVPDALHRKLKARAAQEGKTLSDYLLGELAKISERPTRAELLERLAKQPPLELVPEPAEVIREGRDRR